MYKIIFDKYDRWDGERVEKDLICFSEKQIKEISDMLYSIYHENYDVKIKYIEEIAGFIL